MSNALPITQGLAGAGGQSQSQAQAQVCSPHHEHEAQSISMSIIKPKAVAPGQAKLLHMIVSLILTMFAGQVAKVNIKCLLRGYIINIFFQANVCPASPPGLLPLEQCQVIN